MILYTAMILSPIKNKSQTQGHELLNIFLSVLRFLFLLISVKPNIHLKQPKSNFTCQRMHLVIRISWRGAAFATHSTRFSVLISHWNGVHITLFTHPSTICDSSSEVSEGDTPCKESHIQQFVISSVLKIVSTVFAIRDVRTYQYTWVLGYDVLWYCISAEATHRCNQLR